MRKWVCLLKISDRCNPYSTYTQKCNVHNCYVCPACCYACYESNGVCQANKSRGILTRVWKYI